MTDRPTSSPAGQLSYEDVARFPAPGMALPSQIAFSPGGEVVTYLYDDEGGLERKLHVLSTSGDSPPARLDVKGEALSEEGLSLAEQLRRERAREVGLGITNASWAESADALLVPLPDGLHVLFGIAGSSAVSVRQVLSVEPGDEPVVASGLSPDGASVAFVRQGELNVAPTAEGGEARVLTHSAAPGLANGVAEYIAAEEMERQEGFWWSKDSRLIAYAEVDERHIPVYRIVHQGSDVVGPEAEEDHRYPFAGKENAKVRLGVVAAEGGETVWMDTGDPDSYLARVHWSRDGRLLAEVESRDQTRLEVIAFDVRSGKASLLFAETGEPYVNLHDDFRELSDGRWLWSSERTGYRHIEVRSASGELERTLTSGDWQVDKVEALDEERGLVYFTGTKDGPTERHLYSVPLDGGEVRRITPEVGTHVVVVSPGSGCYVDRHGTLESPPTVRLRSLSDSTLVAPLHDRRDPRIDELALEPPELVSFEADDGTKLYGLVYKPAGLATSADPPPLVVDVYGGPHLQMADNDWLPTIYMRAQALCRRGFCVLTVDNRGSDRRGLAFESALHRNMGEVEVADQVAGVRWAVSQGLADPARVGIFGWSYGGYMTLQCLMRAPETFRAGVAGAPVTAWDGYDTHYTERYMGTPEDDPVGYEQSSVFPYVAAMDGELLIVHGLIDENVHFRHTARLINRLVAARKRYRLLCFPAERHLPRRLEDRAFMEEQVMEFFLEALGDPQG